jgi:hypothetical protein
MKHTYESIVWINVHMLGPSTHWRTGPLAHSAIQSTFFIYLTPYILGSFTQLELVLLGNQVEFYHGDDRTREKKKKTNRL